MTALPAFEAPRLHLPRATLVSDLHLDIDRDTPRLHAFCEWLAQRPAEEPVFLLGDIFEFWIGDDWTHPVVESLVAAFAAARARGVSFHFLAGNRDFLVGEAFAARAGWAMLPDPVAVEIAGRAFVLTHGDLLCTDDHAYQAWRAQARQPAAQAAFLAQPLPARIAFAQRSREQSRAYQGALESPIDVNEGEVRRWLETYPSAVLLHGHTHRCAVHRYSIADEQRERWVLPEWHDTARWLEIVPEGATWHGVTPARVEHR